MSGAKVSLVALSALLPDAAATLCGTPGAVFFGMECSYVLVMFWRICVRFLSDFVAFGITCVGMGVNMRLCFMLVSCRILLRLVSRVFSLKCIKYQTWKSVVFHLKWRIRLFHRKCSHDSIMNETKVKWLDSCLQMKFWVCYDSNEPRQRLAQVVVNPSCTIEFSETKVLNQDSTSSTVEVKLQLFLNFEILTHVSTS